MASEAKSLSGYPSVDRPWLKYYSEEALGALLFECTIYEYLWENNKDYPDDVAMIYFNRKITYRELFENIDRTAAAFTALGGSRTQPASLQHVCRKPENGCIPPCPSTFSIRFWRLRIRGIAFLAARLSGAHFTACVHAIVRIRGDMKLCKEKHVQKRSAPSAT